MTFVQISFGHSLAGNRIYPGPEANEAKGLYRKSQCLYNTFIPEHGVKEIVLRGSTLQNSVEFPNFFFADQGSLCVC